MVMNGYAFGQGEANNWYFGENAGITFNTKPVSALTNGQINTVVDQACMSSKKGQLLFYTDGNSVWDSTHTITSNGKWLNKDSTKYGEACVIVPKPGSPKQYYIFRVEYESGKSSVCYSIFDMTLNSGKGDIISTQKRVRIADASGGRITACQHPNGKDYWLITMEMDNTAGGVGWPHEAQTLNAWLVSSSGISSNPVKSKIGRQFNYGGQIKVSPDGTKIATTSSTPALDSCLIGDFDAYSGKVSNLWRIKLYAAWGFEFSATSNHIYVAESGAINQLYQFNSKALSITDFHNSKIFIDSIARGSANLKPYSSMQLGPDKKIYICRAWDTCLDVINAPDSAGKACRAQKGAVYLGGKRAIVGLPNFMQSFFNPELSFKGTCLGDTAWFAIEDSTEADSVQWTFGDKASKTKNSAKGYKVYHLFSDTGTFKVRSIAYKKNLQDTAYQSVRQRTYLGRFMELKNEIYKCFDDTIELGVAKSNEKSIKWSTGSNTYSTQIVDSGYVWARKYYGSKCYTEDSTRIIFYKNNVLNERFSFGADKLKCHYDSTYLSIVDPKATKYLWSTGSTQKGIFLPQPDTVWLKVYHGKSCYKTDTIGVTNFPISKFTLGPDTFICGKQSIMLGDFNEPQNEYLWFNKSTSAFYSTDTVGKFWVKIKDKFRCYKSDTLNVSNLNPPKASLGKDTAVCSSANGFVLDAKNTSPFNKYKWGTAKISQTDTVYGSGKYWVRISSKCGSSIDTINLKFLTSPKAVLPPDTIFNGPVALLLDGKNSDNNVAYYWSTKATTQTLLVKDTGMYKLVVSNMCGKDSASIHVLKYPDLTSPKIIKSCIKNPVYFSILETMYLDSVTWDFGDTASKSNWSKDIINVTHTYNSYGNFKVILILYYAHKTDTLKSLLTFNDPKTDFNAADVCENDSVHFKNISAETTTSGFRWKFGDGQNSVLVSPSHLYQIGGVSKTFNVTLVSKNSDGCSDSVSKAVSINANPVSDFSFITNQSKVDFKATQSGNTSYKWYFGNGDSASTKDVSYGYKKSGKYTACLKVTNAAGCFSETCKEVSVTVGISQINKPNGLKIYPNPNTGSFTIEIENPAKDVSIELFDVLGNLIKMVKTSPNQVAYKVDLTLVQGIYLVRVKIGDLVYSQKIGVNN